MLLSFNRRNFFGGLGFFIIKDWTCYYSMQKKMSRKHNFFFFFVI